MSDEKRPVIVIRAPMLEWWGTDEDIAELSDEELIELCHEDITSLMEDAEWSVERKERGI